MWDLEPGTLEPGGCDLGCALRSNSSSRSIGPWSKTRGHQGHGQRARAQGSRVQGRKAEAMVLGHGSAAKILGSRSLGKGPAKKALEPRPSSPSPAINILEPRFFRPEIWRNMVLASDVRSRWARGLYFNGSWCQSPSLNIIIPRSLRQGPSVNVLGLLSWIIQQ